MGTISSELAKFSTEVGAQLDSFDKAKEEISTSLTDFGNYTTTFKSGIDTYYNSKSKASLMDNVIKTDESVKEIEESLESFLGVVISKSKEIVALVEELNSINSRISSLNVEDVNYTSNLSSLNSDFNNKEAEAKKLLAELKAIGNPIKEPQKAENVVLEMPTGGSFTKKRFNASNGMSFEYYIYIPEGIDATKELPLHMYMHGSGEKGSGVLNHSLPKMLASGYKPSGIVVCPQMPGDKYGSFQNRYQQPALIEFIKTMSNTYNVDKKRVSISGHSDGAIGGYKLLQDYPGIFSAFIPISGTANRSTHIEQLKSVKVFSFFGDRDAGKGDNYNRSRYYVSAIGGYQHVFRGGGHTIQNDVFNKQYKYADGKVYYPLDWAFSQSMA